MNCKKNTKRQTKGAKTTSSSNTMKKKIRLLTHQTALKPAVSLLEVLSSGTRAWTYGELFAQQFC